MIAKNKLKNLLAAFLFRLLAGVQEILVLLRRAIDGLIDKSECLGHYLATRMLLK